MLHDDLPVFIIILARNSLQSPATMGASSSSVARSTMRSLLLPQSAGQTPLGNTDSRLISHADILPEVEACIVLAVCGAGQ